MLAKDFLAPAVFNLPLAHFCLGDNVGFVWGGVFLKTNSQQSREEKKIVSEGKKLLKYPQKNTEFRGQQNPPQTITSFEQDSSVVSPCFAFSNPCEKKKETKWVGER